MDFGFPHCGKCLSVQPVLLSTGDASAGLPDAPLAQRRVLPLPGGGEAPGRGPGRGRGDLRGSPVSRRLSPLRQPLSAAVCLVCRVGTGAQENEGPVPDPGRERRRRDLCERPDHRAEEAGRAPQRARPHGEPTLCCTFPLIPLLLSRGITSPAPLSDHLYVLALLACEVT